MFPGLKAAQSAMVVNPVKRYSEHKDGVWEVGGGCQDVRMMVTVSPVTAGVCQPPGAAGASHGERAHKSWLDKLIECGPRDFAATKVEMPSRLSPCSLRLRRLRASRAP